LESKLQKKALTPKEVSQVYGLNVGTLANWRYQKIGPRYYRVHSGGTAGSRKVIYMLDDIEAWIKQCPVLTMDSLN
jgi:hypothetical protein